MTEAPTDYQLALFGTYDLDTTILRGVTSSTGSRAYEQRMLHGYVSEYLELRQAFETGEWRFHQRDLEDLILTVLAMEMAWSDKGVQLVELGSSIAPTRSRKLHLMAQAMTNKLDFRRVQFVGVEKSAVFRGLSQALREPYAIQQYEALGEVPRSELPSVFFTHYVGDYVFASAADYVEELRNHGFAIISDSFRPTNSPRCKANPVPGPQLDFLAFLEACAGAGLDVAMTDCFADFSPVRSAPIVRAKLVVGDRACNPKILERLDAGLSACPLSRRTNPWLRGEQIAECFDRVSGTSPEEWSRIRDAKILHQSWDRPSDDALRQAELVRRSEKGFQELHIRHPQIDYLLDPNREP
jgi:hypothetical protein